MALALPFAIGGGIATANFLANQFGRQDNPFDALIQQTEERFEDEESRGVARITDRASRSASASGIGGGTAVNTLIEDMINNFMTDLEQRKQTAIGMLERQSALFQANQPTALQNVAGALSSGAQAGLSVAALSGGLDETLGISQLPGEVQLPQKQVDPFFGTQDLFNFDNILNNPVDQFVNPQIRTV